MAGPSPSRQYNVSPSAPLPMNSEGVSWEQLSNTGHHMVADGQIRGLRSDGLRQTTPNITSASRFIEAHGSLPPRVLDPNIFDGTNQFDLAPTTSSPGVAQLPGGMWDIALDPTSAQESDKFQQEVNDVTEEDVDSSEKGFLNLSAIEKTGFKGYDQQSSGIDRPPYKRQKGNETRLFRSGTEINQGIHTSVPALFQIAQYDNIIVAIGPKGGLPVTMDAIVDLNFPQTYCTRDKARQLESIPNMKIRPFPLKKRKTCLTPFGQMTPYEYIKAEVSVASLHVPPISIYITVLNHVNYGRNYMIIGSSFFKEACLQASKAGITQSPLGRDNRDGLEVALTGGLFNSPYQESTGAARPPQLHISTTETQALRARDLVFPNRSLLVPNASNYPGCPSMSGTQTPITMESLSNDSVPAWSSITSVMEEPTLEKSTWLPRGNGPSPSVPIEPISVDNIYATGRHVNQMSNVQESHTIPNPYDASMGFTPLIHINQQSSGTPQVYPTETFAHQPGSQMTQEALTSQASANNKKFDGEQYDFWPYVDEKGGSHL
ncbi:hypothetical protein F5X99DRAFT_411735 [Biscogniauxia marginata]|nr:hypothetical protein F5X99DRAFT_411735 [Biscogniauxia marginata]